MTNLLAKMIAYFILIFILVPVFLVMAACTIVIWGACKIIQKKEEELEGGN